MTRTYDIKYLSDDHDYFFSDLPEVEYKVSEVKVINSNSEWFGVTYYNDKDIAVKTLDKLVSEGKYPLRLWN